MWPQAGKLAKFGGGFYCGKVDPWRQQDPPTLETCFHGAVFSGISWTMDDHIFLQRAARLALDTNVDPNL